LEESITFLDNSHDAIVTTINGKTYISNNGLNKTLLDFMRFDLMMGGTKEGWAPSEEDVHPLQQAFIETGAVQCGFCIPGFLMAGAKLLEEHPAPTDEQIAQSISGNLCRCTGYYKILLAFQGVREHGR
jgi:aerobic-type carbon monoxide dehydrogenase small subunit (CoxS/CutS family)